MDKALLVGINKYPAAPLMGCVNDISDMADFIVEKCGFSHSNIRLLVDDRATTKNIMERLYWLVDGSSSGDRLFFHYSGHGAQMATRAHDGEIDGLDEVICPVDFDWSDNHVVRDKDFNRIFSAVPDGCEFIWVSDSCHSGDLSKEFPKNNMIAKSFPIPADMAWRNRSAMASKQKALTMRKSAHDNNVALLSGCQSDQTSADATFDGRANGALTYFLLKCLNSTGGVKLTLSDLVKKVTEALAAKGYEQRPGVEGASDIIARSFLKQP